MEREQLERLQSLSKGHELFSDGVPAINMVELMRQTADAVQSPDWEVYYKTREKNGSTVLRKFTPNGNVQVLEEMNGSISPYEHNIEYGREVLGEGYLETDKAKDYRTFVSDLAFVRYDRNGNPRGIGNTNLAEQFRSKFQKMEEQRLASQVQQGLANSPDAGQSPSDKNIIEAQRLVKERLVDNNLRLATEKQALKDESEAKGREIAELKSRLETEQQEKSALKTRIEAQDQEIEKLKDQAEDQSAELYSNSQALEKLDAKVDKIMELFNAQTEELERQKAVAGVLAMAFASQNRNGDNPVTSNGYHSNEDISALVPAGQVYDGSNGVYHSKLNGRPAFRYANDPRGSEYRPVAVAASTGTAVLERPASYDEEGTADLVPSARSRFVGVFDGSQLVQTLVPKPDAAVTFRRTDSEYVAEAKRTAGLAENGTEDLTPRAEVLVATPTKVESPVPSVPDKSAGKERKIIRYRVRKDGGLHLHDTSRPEGPNGIHFAMGIESIPKKSTLEKNDDTVLFDTSNRTLLGVSDGKKANPGAQRAADVTRNTMREILDQISSDMDITTAKKVMVDGILEANRRVRDEQRVNADFSEMQSTAAYLTLVRSRSANYIVWGSVGDTQISILRNGKILELPTKNDQMIGKSDEITPKVDFRRLSLNDKVLIYTNGVHSVLAPRDLEEMFAKRNSLGIIAQVAAESAAEKGKQERDITFIAAKLRKSE